MLRHNFSRLFSVASSRSLKNANYAFTSTGTACQWNHGIQNILISKKPNDEKTTNTAAEMIEWLARYHPHVNVILEPQVATLLSRRHKTSRTYYTVDDDRTEYERAVDLVVTLGGDGTILHVSSLFPNRVPPVMPFSMGTMGFLMPFDAYSYQESLADVFETNKANVLMRSRLRCTLSGTGGVSTDVAMNELTIHRTHTSSHMLALGLYAPSADTQELSHVASTVSDGLILATPTGSTAYSLSTGGPIVHPTVNSMLLAAICPHSLSFRPVVLPSDTHLRVQINDTSRVKEAELVIDGRSVGTLGGENSNISSIDVQVSKHSVPCMTREDGIGNWMYDISHLLKWNQSFSLRNNVKPPLRDPDFD